MNKENDKNTSGGRGAGHRVAVWFGSQRAVTEPDLEWLHLLDDDRLMRSWNIRICLGSIAVNVLVLVYGWAADLRSIQMLTAWLLVVNLVVILLAASPWGIARSRIRRDALLERIERRWQVTSTPRASSAPPSQESRRRDCG